MRLFTFLILLLSFAQCKPSQKAIAEQDAADIAAIRANFSQQVVCWNRGDIDCFMQGYKDDDDIIMISGNGVKQGHATLTRMYKSSFSPDNMGQLQFDNFGYKKLSDQYYAVVGRFQLTNIENGKIRQGWFSLLMERVNDQWLIVSDHTSGSSN